MSTPPTRPRYPLREKKGWGIASFLFKTVWLIAIVYGVVLFTNAWKPAPLPDPADAKAQGPPATAGDTAAKKSPAPPASPEVQTVELTTAASIQKQQLTAAKFKQRQFIAAYDEAKRAIEEWSKEFAAWETAGPPLMTSEAGKRIASIPDLVRRFRVVIAESRPSKEALAQAKNQVEELVKPVKDALANPDDASSPSDELLKALRALLTQAEKARDSYREARAAVEGLLAQAGATATSGTTAPGTKTLQQAIAALTQEEALARASFIDAEEKQAKDEGARLIAEERKRLAAAESASEAGRIREAAERTRQGPMHAGSTWKGTKVTRGEECPSTLTITTRDKDAITGTLTWTYDRRPTSVSIEGTVRGDSVAFKVIRVLNGSGTSGQTYSAKLDLAAQTLSGNYDFQGTPEGSFSYRYQKPAD